jgi:plasmid stabilization system protein ParE
MTRKPARHEVVLTEDAVQDLEELYDYIAQHDPRPRRIMCWMP